MCIWDCEHCTLWLSSYSHVLIMWVVVFFLIYEDPIDACIKSKGIVGPQSLSLVNSSNLLCKLLWFFFIYIYRLGKWSCVLNNWFDLVESKNFFLNFFHGMKRFADSFIIHLHFFVSVDLWSRSRFPIYYQHHQLLLINLVEEIKFL